MYNMITKNMHTRKDWKEVYQNIIDYLWEVRLLVNFWIANSRIFQFVCVRYGKNKKLKSQLRVDYANNLHGYKYT